MKCRDKIYDSFLLLSTSLQLMNGIEGGYLMIKGFERVFILEMFKNISLVESPDVVTYSNIAPSSMGTPIHF